MFTKNGLFMAYPAYPPGFPFGAQDPRKSVTGSEETRGSCQSAASKRRSSTETAGAPEVEGRIFHTFPYLEDHAAFP